ncbi:periplasmic heavy metal sensor [Hyphomonas chukchiensis]|uniref:Periplasmic heavy metal sensor n=1 Tax=Hyphomonas chukchiensis TaxID=1280947 RepID=A0A062UIV5_9PROT|nr:periplasmic heavy metal sensor [Hyphomonas chukchiensis]KCZ58941.1 hypothetical protein HY30_04155 [Hyphomonas chukchiensis]
MSETRPTRRIPFWLTLSVMANLLLVGLLIGMALRAPGYGRGPGGMDGRRPPMMEGASQEDRMVVRKMMMESFQSAEKEVENRRAVRQTLGEALQIDPYDPEAVRRAFASLRIADETVHSKIQEALVHRMGDLTLAQRKSLAEMLSREPGEDRGRRRLRMGDDDDGPHGPPPPDEE